MSNIVLSDLFQNKGKIKYLWILFVVILIIVFAGFFFLIKNKGKQVKVSQVRPDNLGVAKIVLGWMNSQRNKDGVYNYYCQCADTSCVKCKENYYVPRLFPFTTWGRLKYFERTKDPVDYTLFTSELDKAINDGKGIQSDFWNCRLMYDFWNTDAVQTKEKAYARSICERQGREGTITKFDNLDKDFDFNGNAISDILDIVDGKIVLNEKFKMEDLRSDFRKFVGMASDSSYLFLWNGKKSDYLDTIKFFYFALQSYKTVDKNVQNNSWMGIVALDFYRIRNDDRYLALAKFLYDENAKMGYSDVRSANLVYFSFLADELFEITKDIKYKQKNEEIIKEMVNKRFDYKSFGGYRDGIGCFHDKGDWCFTRENALTVGVLSKQ